MTTYQSAVATCYSTCTHLRDDDASECSHYLLQHMHTPPSLDVAVQRVLCPYHQLVATNSANVAAEPAAFVTFHDATLRRMPDDDFYFRAGEHAVGGAAACRHEIDLIRDSLNNSATPRNSCDRQTVELAPLSTDDDRTAAEHWRTTPSTGALPPSTLPPSTGARRRGQRLRHRRRRSAATYLERSVERQTSLSHAINATTQRRRPAHLLYWPTVPTKSRVNINTISRSLISFAVVTMTLPTEVTTRLLFLSY